MQGGSTFKPFVLAAALAQGLGVHHTLYAPRSYASEVFRDCDGGGCEPYTVRNAAFAAHGTYCPPRPVLAITGPDGAPLSLPEPTCTQAVAPEVADTVTAILRGNVDGPWPKTGARASIDRPAAGKTGSTYGSTAAWFAGDTPQLAAVVWVGTPVPTELRQVRIDGRYYRQVYGGTLPATIWGDVVQGALDGVPVAELPEAIRPDPRRPD